MSICCKLNLYLVTACRVLLLLFYSNMCQNNQIHFLRKEVMSETESEKIRSKFAVSTFIISNDDLKPADHCFQVQKVEADRLQCQIRMQYTFFSYNAVHIIWHYKI